MCFGFKPGLAEWKVQTNSLSYGGTIHMLPSTIS